MNITLDKGNFHRLIEQLSIEKVVTHYGISLDKASGGKFKCNCCFHSENTPSLFIYPETNSFFCFGCRSGGDAFSFIKQYELEINNNSYSEVINKLIELSDYKVSLDTVKDLTQILSDTEKQIQSDTKVVESILYFIGIYLRDYLKAFYGTSSYESKVKQINKEFQDLDAIFSKDISEKEANNIFKQIKTKYQVSLSL